MNPTNIKGLTLQELEEFALSIGEKKFRGKQLFDWLYTKEVSTFGEMTSISRGLRDTLESIATIESICIVAMQDSRDGTNKFLCELTDGKKIETVLIPPSTAFIGSEARGEEEQQRLTLCVSTQVGCPLDCKFCATGTMGFNRNLTTGEIIDQILQVKKYTGKRITNLVYMGMGEPLLNYTNVMNSLDIITTAMGIAAKHITLSTVGLVPQIRQLADEQRKMKLAVSLHSLDQTTREMLMPIAKKYSLPELFKSIDYYYRAMKRRPTFEYILFNGINDRDEDVQSLVRLSKRIPCKVNIIPLHGTEFHRRISGGISLRPTPKSRMDEFVQSLRDNHVTVFVRSSAGEDIDAACGQLAVKLERKSGRSDPEVKISKVRTI